MARRRRIVALLLGTLGFSTTGAFLSSCSSSNGKNLVPPETAVSQQQSVASQAVSASVSLQFGLFEISRLIAIGTTQSAFAFVPHVITTTTGTATDTPTPTDTPTGSATDTSADTPTPTPPPTTPPPTPTPPTGGVFSDANSNGIYDYSTLTITTSAGAGYQTGEGTATVAGIVTTTDDTPSSSTGNFHGALGLNIKVSSGAPWGWLGVDDQWTDSFRSTPSALAQYDLVSTFVDAPTLTVSTGSIACLDVGVLHLRYSASGGVWNPGTPVIPGTLLVSGTGAIEVGTTTFLYDLTTTTALTIVPASTCPQEITGGRIDLAFGTNGAYSVHWTGCNTQTVAPR